MSAGHSGADIVDGNRDIMQAHLSGDVDHEIQIVDHLGAVDLDRSSRRTRDGRASAAEVAHRLAAP